jgi:hypothetical protein
MADKMQYLTVEKDWHLDLDSLDHGQLGLHRPKWSNMIRQELNKGNRSHYVLAEYTKPTVKQQRLPNELSTADNSSFRCSATPCISVA